MKLTGIVLLQVLSLAPLIVAERAQAAGAGSIGFFDLEEEACDVEQSPKRPRHLQRPRFYRVIIL